MRRANALYSACERVGSGATGAERGIQITLLGAARMASQQTETGARNGGVRTYPPQHRLRGVMYAA
jgi:hypothetical protein